MGALPERDRRAVADGVLLFADDELEQIAARRGVYGRFAIAAAVGALRWLGFVPAALDELPEPAAALIARQLDLTLSSIDPARVNTERDARAEHIEAAIAISAFGPCRDSDLGQLRAWLPGRALGHDGPLALLRVAVDRLRRQALVRPGLTVLERLVAAARGDADQELRRRVGPLLTPGLERALDEPLIVPAGATAAVVKQLARETRSLARIGEPIEKLALLRELGAEDWESRRDPGQPPADARAVRSACDQPGDRAPRRGLSPSGAAGVLCRRGRADHRRDRRSPQRRRRGAAREGMLGVQAGLAAVTAAPDARGGAAAFAGAA